MRAMKMKTNAKEEDKLSCVNKGNKKLVMGEEKLLIRENIFILIYLLTEF